MGAGCEHKFRDVLPTAKKSAAADLATPGDPFVLAIQVLQVLGGGPHTVTSQLDRDRPETIHGWTFLQDALRIAYNQGVSDSKPANPESLTHAQTLAATRALREALEKDHAVYLSNASILRLVQAVEGAKSTPQNSD
jgi:hypothetical protein